MEVKRCLEYYFEKDTTREEIMKYIEKKIEELKKISKIKNIRIKIIQNEYKAKKATLILIIERKTPKKPKTEIKRYKIKKEEKQPKHKKEHKEQKQTKQQKEHKEQKQMKQQKEHEEQKQTKELKNEKQQDKNSIIKKNDEKQVTETKQEEPVRKYGAYKDGGKFVPYQEKKKKKRKER